MIAADIPGDAGQGLEETLETFARSHAAARVEPAPLALTAAFHSPDAGRHVAPRSFGRLPETQVMGYVVRGAALVSKYARDPAGRVRRDADGHPVLAPFGAVQRTMACLCIRDLRNTSLHEIGDALCGTHRLQGFRRWHVHRLTAAAAAAAPGFAVDRDSLFLFAGPPDRLVARIALNALWLEGILQHGARAPDTLCAAEHARMAEVFPPEVLRGCQQAILQRSYMWGRPLWQPQSAAFLARKAAAWRRFGEGVRGAGARTSPPTV